MGGPLLNRALLEWVIPIAKFQTSPEWDEKEINQRNPKGILKVPWVNSFIQLRCYLTKGSERPLSPLLNRAPSDRLFPNAKLQISPGWD